MHYRKYFWGFVAGPSLFIAALVADASCSNNPQPTDVTDVAMDAVSASPCQDGTIQLLSCDPDDGAVVEDPYTDEACDSLDDAEHRTTTVHDDAMAPAVDMPTEAQALPSGTPFRFAWHPQTFSRAPGQRRTSPTWRNELARWMTLVPAAEAHCSPFGGIAYSLTFTAANNQVILRAQTSLRTFTPTAESWMRLRAALGTIVGSPGTELEFAL